MRARSLLPFLLLLAACFIPPYGTYRVYPSYDRAVVRGYWYAVECLRAKKPDQPVRSINSVQLWIVPGLSFDDEGNTSEGGDLPYQGLATYDLYSTVQDIYVAEMASTRRSVWAHEWLHAILHERGHPLIFAKCGL